MSVVEYLAMRAHMATLPGQNMKPQAPGELGARIERFLNIASWIGIAACIFGIIGLGVAFLVARNRGMTEEVTEYSGRIIVGCVLVGMPGTIVQLFVI